MILTKTQSICPKCGKILEAAYVKEENAQGGGAVYFEKTCDKHGTFKVLAAQSEEDYLAWAEHSVINIPPKKPLTKGAGGRSECPLHCGTCEDHLQTACCVLIDVTDSCNQKCPFCFASAGDTGHKRNLTLKEIEAKYDLLLDLGEERTFNIQLSGGEPTVRDDLTDIISMARSKGFEYVQINTNGRRIAEEDNYARELKEAGATVIYMQFDGTDDEIYKALRAEPLFELKKRAINNCRKAGLPVILVPTVTRDVNFSNIGEMIEFLLENIDVVKGIHFQPAAFFGRHPGGEDSKRVTMFDVMRQLEKQTQGAVKYDDLCPISTGHPLCCFYGTFKKEGGNIRSMLSVEAKSGGVSCCGETDPLSVIKKDRDFVLNKWNLPTQTGKYGGKCGEGCEPEEEKGGDKYGEGCEPEEEKEGDKCGEGCEPQWEQSCCCGGAQSEEDADFPDLDSFLNDLKTNLFTLSGMAFMDKGNLDAERLKRCRVQQLTDDNRLIPFCAYNSTYR